MRDFLAIVVGVEKYASDELGELDGPASDAAAFARWLLDCGIAAGDIRLFLSLRPGALPPDTGGLSFEAATEAEIRQALEDDLDKTPPRQLCLFWGGHGMMKLDGQSKFFFADARLKNLRALDLGSLLQYLKSNAVGGENPDHLRQTFVIADACANYAELKGVAGSIPDHDFPVGPKPVVLREQFVLLSASVGQYAKNLTAQKTGLFSREFLDHLRNEKAVAGRLDLAAIAASLEKRFEALRQEGKTSQQPVFYALRNWNAPAFNRLGSPELDHQSSNYSVTRLEIGELVEISGRIQPPVREEISRRAFQKLLPTAPPPTLVATGMETFRWCLYDLRERVPERLFEFLELGREHLTGLHVPGEVAAWEKRVATRLGLDLAQCAANAQLLKPLLPAAPDSSQVMQVVVECLPGCLKDQDKHRLHACVRLASASAAPPLHQCAAPEVATQPAELSRQFTRLFGEAFAFVTSLDGFRVEAALPVQLLAAGVDGWQVPLGRGVAPLVQHYTVALRSFDRHYLSGYRNSLLVQQQKWQRLQAGLVAGSVAWVEQPLAAGSASFTTWEDQYTLALCATTLAAVGDGLSLADLIEALVLAGIPMALWLQGHEGDAPTARLALEKQFITGCPPADWLACARNFRRNPPVLCQGLTLLWDDPTQALPSLGSRQKSLQEPRPNP